jgi:hypothetical protein
MGAAPGSWRGRELRAASARGLTVAHQQAACTRDLAGLSGSEPRPFLLSPNTQRLPGIGHPLPQPVVSRLDRENMAAPSAGLAVSRVLGELLPVGTIVLAYAGASDRTGSLASRPVAAGVVPDEAIASVRTRHCPGAIAPPTQRAPVLARRCQWCRSAPAGKVTRDAAIRSRIPSSSRAVAAPPAGCCRSMCAVRVRADTARRAAGAEAWVRSIPSAGRLVTDRCGSRVGLPPYGIFPLTPNDRSPTTPGRAGGANQVQPRLAAASSRHGAD